MELVGEWVERVGGWLEIWREKLISTQFVVEVGVELGNKYILNFIKFFVGRYDYIILCTVYLSICIH